MKISTRGRYALRFLMDLALHGGERYIPLREISARQDISLKYLEQIVSLFQKNGFLKSTRGASGGYVLARNPEEISVGDVLRALEGSLEPVKCAAFSDGEECMAAGGCVTKYVWQKINESISRTVDEIHLDELVQESKELNPSGECENPKCGN